MSGQIEQAVEYPASNSYKTGRSMNAQHLRLTFMHTLKSEIVKLRGLASTWWCMALTIVLPVIFSFIIALVQKAMSKVDVHNNGAAGSKSSAAITVGPSDKVILLHLKKAFSAQLLALLLYL